MPHASARHRAVAPTDERFHRPDLGRARGHLAVVGRVHVGSRRSRSARERLGIEQLEPRRGFTPEPAPPGTVDPEVDRATHGVTGRARGPLGGCRRRVAVGRRCVGDLP